MNLQEDLQVKLTEIDEKIDALVKERSELLELLTLYTKYVEREGRNTVTVGSKDGSRYLYELFDGSDTPARRTAQEAVTNAAALILKDGRPRRTMELLTLLKVQGIAVGGANKLQMLSTLLSKDGRFEADRRTGWTLAARKQVKGKG